MTNNGWYTIKPNHYIDKLKVGCTFALYVHFKSNPHFRTTVLLFTLFPNEMVISQENQII